MLIKAITFDKIWLNVQFPPLINIDYLNNIVSFYFFLTLLQNVFFLLDVLKMFSWWDHVLLWKLSAQQLQWGEIILETKSRFYLLAIIRISGRLIIVIASLFTITHCEMKSPQVHHLGRHPASNSDSVVTDPVYFTLLIQQLIVI